MKLTEYISKAGEIILYTGHPDLHKLDELSLGPGDVWHSSLDQGFKNAFPELMYQTAVFYWYLNDFDNHAECVSWRINPKAFAVRKSIWDHTTGFDTDYENEQMQALDFGFRLNRYLGGVTLHVQNLYSIHEQAQIVFSAKDRHLFFRKNFKASHSLYMIFRLGFWRFSEWKAFFYAKNKIQVEKKFISTRQLQEIQGNPTVSYIIPTMYRQEYTMQLLDDLANQNYAPTQVIVIDATPHNQRTQDIYFKREYPFELIVRWQQSEGSCRARNEAIELCLGDYIVFGDDDIRIPPNFIENHIRLLQTYRAGACNGLDIRADNCKQDLGDLQKKLDNLDTSKFIAGSAQSFSNANSCVKKEFVDRLIGNDINFDGGYGEDSDFGMSLVKIGVTVLFNPFSANLHLKPPSGGYRFWGNQASIVGKKRKTQPWEQDNPVKRIKPVPSPTIMYGVLKHYSYTQVQEYKYKHFLHFLFKGSTFGVLFRLLYFPYKNLQFRRSIFYAQKLLDRGIRYR